MMFNDDDEIIPPPGPEPIGPGRVELDIRNNETVPVEGNSLKVLLKLTGENKSTSGLDLVAVLDVSGSMGKDDKIGSMRKAMKLVTQKLSPQDRLSIVSYSTEAKKVCKLTRVTEDSKKNLDKLINDLVADGSTNISDGLKMGLNVLNGRKFSIGRFGVIMLMTDGKENNGSDAASVRLGNVPVHTFGFGKDQDTKVLSAIARNNPLGGTYNDVDIKNLNLAFSQCLGGLLTVVAHDVTVTITPFKEVSKINTVSAGSYSQDPGPEPGSKSIKFGVLYIQEVRLVLVDLQILPIETEPDPTVLTVDYKYSFNGQPIGGNPITINVTRKSGLTPEELKAPPEVRAEEVRLLMADVVKEATHHADNKNLEKAREKISDGLKTLENADIVQLKAELSAELKELRKLMATTKIYEEQGRPFAYSLLISLATQRQAARGEDMSQFQLFTTPVMQEFLKDAKNLEDLQRHVDEVLKALESVEKIIDKP